MANKQVDVQAARTDADPLVGQALEDKRKERLE